MPHPRDKASRYHSGNGTIRMRVTPKTLTISIGGISIAAVAGGLLWAADNIKQVQTNKQDIVVVKDAAKETNKTLQVHDKRLTAMEIEHKAMMKSIDRRYAENTKTMDDVKGLMKTLIELNRGHKHE